VLRRAEHSRLPAPTSKHPILIEETREEKDQAMIDTRKVEEVIEEIDNEHFYTHNEVHQAIKLRLRIAVKYEKV
jgi:hypothetical protein